MKRLIRHIAMGLAAGLLWSCSQQTEEVQPTLGSSIDFSSEMSETATKAGTLPVPFDNFRLYGVKKVSGELKAVFDDYGFVRASGDASGDANWEYASHRQSLYPNQSRQYWDYEAREYRFIAGAPYSNVSFEPQYGLMTLDGLDYGFEVLADTASTLTANPYFSPYLSYPNQVLAADFDKTVAMNFRYALSKVKLIFYFENEQETDMLIDNITFTPRTGGEYATRGKLEVTYEFEHTPKYKTELVAASADMTTDSVRFSDMRIAEPCTTQVVAPEAYWMLPSCKNYNTAWDVKVHVRPVNTPDFVPSLGGKTFTAKVAGSDMFWEPGYAYTYVFMLKDDGIEYISKIQMGITEWDVRTADRHDFYTW